MAYSSSTVTKGRATGMVVACAMETEIGSIAQQLRSKSQTVRVVKKDENGEAPAHRYLRNYALRFFDGIGEFLGVNVGTPLQRRLSQLAVFLFFIALLFAFIVFAANNFNTSNEVILYAVATGVSMLPASLVVVLTITLAGGTRAMVKKQVIVRKLSALEALGGVSDICSDKTGTLTTGVMIAKAAWIPGVGRIEVDESDSSFIPSAFKYTSQLPISAPSEDDEELISSISSTPTYLISKHSTLIDLLEIAGMCNLATVKQEDGEWKVRGDPTECAIQVFSKGFGFGREELAEKPSSVWSPIAEFPFDSDVKRMR